MSPSIRFVRTMRFTLPPVDVLVSRISVTIDIYAATYALAQVVRFYRRLAETHCLCCPAVSFACKLIRAQSAKGYNEAITAA